MAVWFSLPSDKVQVTYGSLPSKPMTSIVVFPECAMYFSVMGILTTWLPFLVTHLNATHILHISPLNYKQNSYIPPWKPTLLRKHYLKLYIECQEKYENDSDMGSSPEDDFSCFILLFEIFIKLSPSSPFISPSVCVGLQCHPWKHGQSIRTHIPEENGYPHSSSSHWLSIALQLGVRLHEPLPHPCWDFS